jgi:hypothetical protein
VAALLLLLAFAVAALAAWRSRLRLPAQVRIVDPEGPPTLDAAGAARSVQAAELTMHDDVLIELWSPEALERLARSYWRFLERCTLGLIRVRYSERDRAIVFLFRPIVLIGFDPPEYEIDPQRGIVRWRIRRGLLVSAQPGGDGGLLAIDVRRLADPAPGLGKVHVEVALLSYRPAIAGAFGYRVYAATQSATHVLITHAFLRSLAKLDLARSRTGRFDASRGGDVERLAS